MLPLAELFNRTGAYRPGLEYTGGFAALLLAVQQSANWKEQIAPLGVWNIGRARYYHDDAFEEQERDLLRQSSDLVAGGQEQAIWSNFSDSNFRLPSFLHPHELYSSPALRNVIQRVHEQGGGGLVPEQLLRFNKRTKTYNLSLKFRGALQPSFLHVDDQQGFLLRKIRIAFNKLEARIFDHAVVKEPASAGGGAAPSPEVIRQEENGQNHPTSEKQSGDLPHFPRAGAEAPLSPALLAPLLLPLSHLYTSRINGEHVEWFYHDIIGRGTGGNGESAYVCADSRNTEMVFAHPFLRVLVHPAYHKVFDELKLLSSYHDEDRKKQRPIDADEYGLMEHVTRAVMASTKEPPVLLVDQIAAPKEVLVGSSSEDSSSDSTSPATLAAWFTDAVGSAEFRAHSCPLVRVYVGLLATLRNLQRWEQECIIKKNCAASPENLRREVFDFLVERFRTDNAFSARGLRAWRHSILRYPPILYALDRLRHASSVVSVRVEVGLSSVLVVGTNKSPNNSEKGLDRSVGAGKLLDLRFGNPFDVPVSAGPDSEKPKNGFEDSAFSTILHLPVHPFRERASDLTRRNRAPYCNVEVLRIVLTLALLGLDGLISTSSGMKKPRAASIRLPIDLSNLIIPVFRLLDIGANMGDCAVFFLKLFPHWTGLAVEAIGPSAALIGKSAQLNKIGEERFVIKHAAVSSSGASRLVLRAPRSSLQRGTVFCEAGEERAASDHAADGEVWPSLSCADASLGARMFGPNPHLVAPREWAFFAANTTTLAELLNTRTVPVVSPKSRSLLLINTIGHEHQVLESGNFSGPSDPRLPDFVVFQVYGLGGVSLAGASTPAPAANQLIYKKYQPVRIFDLLTRLDYSMFRLVDAGMARRHGRGSSSVSEGDSLASDGGGHDVDSLLAVFRDREAFRTYVESCSSDFDVLAVRAGIEEDET